MAILEARERVKPLPHDQPKIWFISGAGPQIWGGGLEEAVNVASKQFAALGADVSCLHGVIYNRPQRVETLPDNLSFTEIPLSPFTFKGYSIDRYFLFRRLLATARPDYAVINMPGKIGLMAALALRDTNIPTTFWWHSTHVAYESDYDYQNPATKVKGLVKRIIVNSLEKLATSYGSEAANFQHAACSNFTAEVLKNKGVLAGRNVRTLNPATSVGLKSIHLGGYLEGVGDDDLVVFIPARVALDKQFYNVRELVAGLQTSWSSNQRIHFVSAGPVSSADYLDYAFPQVDTPILKTTYLGVLDKQNMERVYGRADCILMPNRAEPFGLSTVEGMRFGLPVLGFNSGGTAEILAEFPHYPKLLIDQKRGQIRIDPVRAFLEDVVSQRSVGLNQRPKVLKRFDPQKLADQVWQFVTAGDLGRQIPYS